MSGKLVCRVCGKEYEGCRTAKYIDGQFRWQDVACCPEHGSIYLERIIASRSKNKTEVKKTKEKIIVPAVENVVNIPVSETVIDNIEEDDDSEEEE